MTNEQRIENLEVAVLGIYDLIKDIADIQKKINEELLKKLEDDNG